MVEKANPDGLFSIGKGNERIKDIYFTMMDGKQRVNMSERLMSDPGFIQKLNNKYSNYKFQIDDYKKLLVTRLV